ncbi:hypothetical protein H7271_06430 [Bittarella massiliensis]|uniref:phage replication initiation protein, NGO0469 family n=1 Tax=Bittarella massiliensis (ex Durand et al. 2017) TaxID=1720313 RepID=UPI00163C5EDE|nr:hypothetical protein [Bittarella massiliensis (ex Durand et al. 2017)]MBC2871239.1 hypothetical protein [Bittarella massiliensis (ex Durand et al. 2017)]
MGFIVSEGSKKSFSIPEGNYAAVCTGLIDLGEVENKLYGKVQKKILVMWQIPEVPVTVNGQERGAMISKEYTASLGEKANLRSDLEAWRGKKFTPEELEGFDVKNLLGACCYLQIIHNDKGYANVNSIMSLPKGMPKIVVDPSEYLVFDFDDDEPAEGEEYERIPKWIQDKIESSLTYAKKYDFEEISDDGDLPF